MLGAGLLEKLRERQEAKKLADEWAKPATERIRKEHDCEMLKTVAFQLRNFFLSVKAMSLSDVVAKLVFNFETLHNNYLCTSKS